MGHHIAIMLPNWIGDAAMATPTVRALRAGFPESRITGIMRPYVQDVLAGNPHLDATLLYHNRPRDKVLTRRQLVGTLRRLQVNDFLLLPNSLSSGILAWLSGARRRIGYARYGRGPLLTDRLQPRRQGRRLEPVSAVDYYLALARHLGCPGENDHLEIFVTPLEMAQAERVWQSFRWENPERVVCLSTGGAYGAAKHWPAEYASSLARLLVEEFEASVLVLGGPSEAAVVRNIAADARSPHVKACPAQAMTIALSKALIARSQLLISTDSGPRHLAAGLGVPVVSLFGSTDPRWATNRHAQETLLQNWLPCAPCAKRTCPLGHHRCMRSLTPEQVATAAASLLEQPQLSRRAA